MKNRHYDGMRQVLYDIEAGRVADELLHRGIARHQRVRVVVETLPSDAEQPEEPPVTAINAAGGAFDWLADEPDLYSDSDLIERYPR
jgi:hypothetical protein